MVDPYDVQQSKLELRRRMRALRKSLSTSQKEAEQAGVCHGLAARVALEPALVVASYAALPDELSVDAWHAQCWSAGHAVWLPRVVAPGVLSWHPVTDPTQLVTGSYSIREPHPEEVPAQPLPLHALLVVPGVAFTTDGWRLGQGGGFYDRLLVTHQGPTIGVAFVCQRVADVPRGPDDCRVSEVIFGG